MLGQQHLFLHGLPVIKIQPMFFFICAKLTGGGQITHFSSIATAAAWYCMVPVPVPWLSLFKQICRYRKYNHEVFSFIVHRLAVLAIHRAA